MSMGAILGGTMRSPLTGIVFALELTHDVNVLLPLLVAATVAHGFTVLALRRSILTEKVSRRGYHLSREYAVDPLEILFVREVMRTKVVALAGTTRLDDLPAPSTAAPAHGQRLYPVVEGERLVGRGEPRGSTRDGGFRGARKDTRREAVPNGAVVAHPDEPLRAVVYRMAETGHTRLPVVDRNGEQQLVGLVSLEDLLKARAQNLDAERRRERVNAVDLFFPRRRPAPSPSAP